MSCLPATAPLTALTAQEMVRCLQDMEQHYRGALEEKVWEIIEMRDANEALSKQFVDANAARAALPRACRAW